MPEDGIDFDPNNVMEDAMARCKLCGHSRAAHVDGVRCALCGCLPERRNFVQDAFAFRSALPGRVMTDTRKR
jgi:ribosomal protein L37E